MNIPLNASLTVDVILSDNILMLIGLKVISKEFVTIKWKILVPL